MVRAHIHSRIQAVTDFAKDYGNRNFFWRLLRTDKAQKFHEEKVQELADLIAAATLSVAVETHNVALDMHAEVKAMADMIKQQTPFVVRLGGVHKHACERCLQLLKLQALLQAVPCPTLATLMCLAA